MSNVQMVAEENILLAAYRQIVNEEKKDPQDLITEYENHFSSVVSPASKPRHVFERFSMTDPNVRVVIKSSTSAN